MHLFFLFFNFAVRQKMSNFDLRRYGKSLRNYL